MIGTHCRFWFRSIFCFFKINKETLTPRNISVSSEHVLVFFDDCNRMVFPITSAVEGTGSPAMSGGLPTQSPFAVVSNRRLKAELFCY